MRDEITAAVLFLTRLIGKNENLSDFQVENFKAKLCILLQERFQNHWFPEQPFKGQGYRCIRVNEFNRIDPILKLAAQDCGFKYEDLQLPMEFTLWVDPNEVCCRFGEHKGSYCILASFKDGNRESCVDSVKIEDLGCEETSKKVPENDAMTMERWDDKSEGAQNVGQRFGEQSGTRVQYCPQSSISHAGSFVRANLSHCYFIPLPANSVHNPPVISSSPPPLPIAASSTSLTMSASIYNHGRRYVSLLPQQSPSVLQGLNYSFAPVITPSIANASVPISSDHFHWIKQSLIKA